MTTRIYFGTHAMFAADPIEDFVRERLPGHGVLMSAYCGKAFHTLTPRLKAFAKGESCADAQARQYIESGRKPPSEDPNE